MVMRSNPFRKSSIRAVKSSLSRFLSIMLISFVGANVLGGLAATSPNMRQVGDEYYDSQNIKDIRMLSTYGFTDDDVEAIKEVSGVWGAMPGYSVDASGTVTDKDYTFRINSIDGLLPPDDINRFTMIEGRLPENAGEAVIIRPSIGLKNIANGSIVKLNEASNSALPDMLSRLEYTIVGIAESSYYISFIQGSSSVGSGSINYVLYVPRENFISEVYTDILVTVQGAKELPAFEEEYFDYIEDTANRLEDLAKARQSLRFESLNSDLEKAKQDLADAEKEADEKMGDAKIKLDDGEKELKEANEAYVDGLAEYKTAKADTETELADAKLQLEEAEGDIAEGKREYNDGLAEYKKQKSEADKQFAAAKSKLDDALSQIEAGETELASKKQEMSNGESALEAARATLDSGWSDYRKSSSSLKSAKAEFNEGKSRLDAAQIQYDEGARAAQASMGMSIDEIASALPSILSQIEASRAQYEAISQLAALNAAREAANQEEYDAVNERYQNALRAAALGEEEAAYLMSQMPDMKAQISAAQAQYDQLNRLVASKAELSQRWSELNAAAAQLKEGEKKLDAARKSLESGEAEYAANILELEKGKEQIKAAEDELAQARASYQSGLEQYNEQKAEADKKLASAKAELDKANKEIASGEKELAEKWQEYYDGEYEAETKFKEAEEELEEARINIADGEVELADARREYETKKLEANTELADARLELEEAEEALSGLGEPKWYVLDRHMNEGFAAFEDAAERMQNIVTVFPVVFFLVAVLVCLTTMARMVDEDRILIGTFKALGYSNRRIAGRYLGYAASASFIGSIFGAVAGFWLLPIIIWESYRIMFAAPAMTPVFHMDICLIAVSITTAVTTLSAGIAARNALRDMPAGLLRPKAPQKGKRIFLEHIRPIWRRLSFTRKVTFRNLGLNKKRLIMSLAGIAGCTALVLTALGANRAISGITDDQFIEIFHYNLTVGYNDAEPSPELAEHMSDRSYFDKAAVAFHSSAQTSFDANDKESFSAYIVSPMEESGFSDYITLSDYKTKAPIDFTENSVIIAEKLSINIGVGVGDTIMIKYLDKDEYYPAVITDITRNYTFNQVYFGRSAYENVFGEPPEYNQYYVIMNDSAAYDEIAAFLAGTPGIGFVSFTDDLMGNVKNSIKSVDKIIWVLIVSAGLLAFTVIYNLTNINIGERHRELATLKVLGFFDRETYSYIFKENAILSLMGGAVGLFVGVFLYRAVVATIEPDMIFFTRTLTWQSYLGAGLLIMLFTWVVNQFMKPVIRNIDMLESLKSVE